MLNEGEDDGWVMVNDLQGIAIWKKADGSPTGILKGIGLVERAKPYEVIAVATTIDIRSHCTIAFPRECKLKPGLTFFLFSSSRGCAF